MPEPRDITTRDLEGKVIGYGNRVVAQGANATKPPAAMTSVSTQTAAPPTLLPAVVTLYDPFKMLQGSVASAVHQRIETDLNSLHFAGVSADYLATKLGLRFEVRHLYRMSSRDERFAAGVFDFPVYLLHRHGGSQTTASQILELMLDHGIRDAGIAADQFEQAKAEWEGSAEGLGIQPLSGYKKVGFIKADEVDKAASDLVIGFSNIIKHELGHMMNLMAHKTDEVMRVPATYTVHLNYSQQAANIMLNKLTELKKVPKVDLEQRYARQNP
jgi:hypothetical protein